MNKKSQKLSKEERSWLRRLIKDSGSVQAAGDVLGIPRTSINNINTIGSGSPENVAKIREAINQPA